MKKSRASAPKARLVDMEVEEVSLVDRAANKRKFLVVKRSEAMSQEPSSGEGNDNNEEGDTPEGEEGSDTDHASLDVAATALDGLTSAMARLQNADGEALRGELENVVEELRGAADALADQLSNDGEDDDEENDSQGDEHTDTDIRPLLGAVTALVAEMRAARTGTPAAKATRAAGRSAGGRRGGAGGSAPRDEDEDLDDEEQDDDDEEEERPPLRRRSPPKPAPKRKDAGSSGLQADLRALRTDLKTFSGSLQEQAKRLAKLEKRAAPPSSRSPGERPTPSRGAGEAAWPLDLNAPPLPR